MKKELKKYKVTIFDGKMVLGYSKPRYRYVSEEKLNALIQEYKDEGLKIPYYELINPENP